MFTGLVEEQGQIRSIEASESNAKNIHIACSTVCQDVAIGDSICINGCCLTVVSVQGEVLAFQAGNETLSRTNLGQLEPGDFVNLERALRAGDRLGGHYVSGHVDGLAKVSNRVDDNEWSYFWFELDSELTKQMASKGSVTIDGISLTLVDVKETEFSVALIPHTLQVTTLGDREVGDLVNIETDILAKYVQQQLLRQKG